MGGSNGPVDTWSTGESYESYVGRWSRPVAAEFLRRLDRPAGQCWLDVGCGTGALTEAILATGSPAAVTGVDPSDGFVAYAASRLTDPRASFRVGDARALPVEAAAFDVVVSALALNFVPDQPAALTEMRRAARAGGVVAAYVWDYLEGMQLLRYFWDAVVALDPASRPLDEGVRFGVCRPEPLRALFTGAGLLHVEVEAIVVPTVFADFDDYWQPFLGGQGPAPSYVAALPEAGRTSLRERLRDRLPTRPDGSIPLSARAWSVRGVLA